MILSFLYFYSLVILLVSLFSSCFRYFYVFINFIGDTSKIIVKRYWIALEIALYKFIIIIIIIIIIMKFDKNKKKKRDKFLIILRSGREKEIRT